MSRLIQMVVLVALLAANGIATTASAAGGISIAHFGHSFYPPEPTMHPHEPTLHPYEPTLRRHVPPQPTLRRYFPPNPI